MAFSACATSMHSVVGSMSTKTGTAPRYRQAIAVASHVSAGTITSSPGPTPQAAIEAIGNLRDATLGHAEVPCEGIGLNRECDRDAQPLEEVLSETWRPARPELTDTTCHVVAARAGDVQDLILVAKTPTGLRRCQIAQVRFVPLIGHTNPLVK